MLKMRISEDLSDILIGIYAEEALKKAVADTIAWNLRPFVNQLSAWRIDNIILFIPRSVSLKKVESWDGLLIAYEFRDMHYKKCMFFMADYFILDRLAERRSKQIRRKKVRQRTRP